MNKASAAVLFSTAGHTDADGVPLGKDNWQTPTDLFTTEHDLHHYTIDAAADATNHLLPRWWGPGSPLGENALEVSWMGEHCWLNPPYSMMSEFVGKAWNEMVHHQASITMLIPARTDTRYWHKYIWDVNTATWRPGVSGRFIKGRLKFINPNGGKQNPAPFPSVLIDFNGQWKQESLF